MNKPEIIFTIFIIFISITIFAAVLIIIKNEGEYRVCKEACFPIVHRIIDGECYCADGENWKQYKEGELGEE